MPKRHVILLMLVLGITGCRGQPRPTVAEWQPHWDRVVSGVPPLEELRAEDPKVMCAAALTLVREERLLLLPAPESTLDDPVDGWLSIADETFFECPPRSGEIQGFTEAFEVLKDYRAEVDAALDN